MIKRIPEYSKPKVWCPREDYHFPEDGISMSITSAFPSSTNEESEIYRNTEVNREDDGTFTLQLSKVIAIDSKSHRYTIIISNIQKRMKWIDIFGPTIFRYLTPVQYFRYLKKFISKR